MYDFDQDIKMLFSVYITRHMLGIVTMFSLLFLAPFSIWSENFFSLVSTGNAYHAATQLTIQEVQTAGENVNTRSPDGRTALMFVAAYNSNVSVVRALINKGAKISARSENGETALMMAVTNSDTPEVITLLLQNGANINARNAAKLTPLMLAAKRSHLLKKTVPIIRILLENGADVDAITSSNVTKSTVNTTNTRVLFSTKIVQETALMIAAKYSSNPEVIITFLNAKAEISCRNADGKTALDLMKQNDKLYKTDAYWHLSDLSYNQLNGMCGYKPQEFNIQDEMKKIDSLIDREITPSLSVPSSLAEYRRSLPMSASERATKAQIDRAYNSNRLTVLDMDGNDITSEFIQRQNLKE